MADIRAGGAIRSASIGKAGAAALGAIVLFGAIVRIARLGTASLWTDEAYSVAVAHGSALDVFVAGLRFDIHPPLYYLQLHFWQLVSDADVWLLANSLLFSFAAGASLFVVMRRLHDDARALLALAFFAVTPLQVIFSETLRMYTLEALLVVWQFYCVERIVRADDRAMAARVGYVLLGTGVNLVHGFGFAVNFFLILYSAWRAVEERRWRVLWRPLLVCAILIGLSTPYALVMGATRQTIGADQVGLADLGSNLTITTLGFELPHVAIMGVIFVGPFLLLALAARTSRAVMAWLFLIPSLFMILVSVAVKPVYTFRASGLFTPFLAIAFAGWAQSAIAWSGGGATAARRGAGPLAVAAAFAVFTIATIHGALHYAKVTPRALALDWAARSAPGDALYVDSFISDYMNVIHYLPGARHTAALEIQAPASAQWRRLAQRIGAPLAARLNLLGREDHLAYTQGRSVYPWLDATAVSGRDRFWAARYDARDCGVPGYVVAERRRFESFTLLLCRR